MDGITITANNAILSLKRFNKSMVSATKAAGNLSKALDGLPKSPLQKIVRCIEDTVAILPILNPTK